MRPVNRERTIAADAESVWEVVSDPSRLPGWWPGVARVEEATPTAWTQVMTSANGRSVRADFTRTDWREHERLAWRQELEGSPFERLLAAAGVEIELEPAGPRATRVALRSVERLRGRNRLGGMIVRRAARKRLEQALDGLERTLTAT